MLYLHLCQHSHIHPWASFGIRSCLAQVVPLHTGLRSTPPTFPPVPGRISYRSYSVPLGSDHRQDLCLPCWSCWEGKLVLDRQVAQWTLLLGSVLCPFQYGYLTDVTTFTFKSLPDSHPQSWPAVRANRISVTLFLMRAGMCFYCVFCLL